MGCDVSKVTDSAHEHALTNNNSDRFTDNQIDTIRSTWPLLARDIRSHGEEVFRLIFMTEPRIKKLFKQLSNMHDEEALKSSVLQAHVYQFMNMVDTVVENFDSNAVETEKDLLILGAKHGMYEDFQQTFFGVYTKCLMTVMETVIAEEFLPEVRDSWEALLAYIVQYMSEGFYIYTQEHQHEADHEEDVIG